jgi:hypothetical protein
MWRGMINNLVARGIMFKSVKLAAFLFVVFFSTWASAQQVLKPGGIYAIQRSNGTYSLVKILVLEPNVTHIRSYTNKYTTLPTSVDEESLQYSVGHTPVEAKTFAMSNLVLVKQSQVTAEELEGYTEYKRAIGEKSAN